MFCYQNTKNVLWSCFNVFLDHSCFDTQRKKSPVARRVQVAGPSRPPGAQAALPSCVASANLLCRSSPRMGRDLGGHALYRSPAGDETGSCAVSNLSCVKASPLQNLHLVPDTLRWKLPGRFRWAVGPQGCLDRGPEGAGRVCGGFSLAERGVQGCCVLTPIHMGRLRRWLGRPLPALAGASG